MVVGWIQAEVVNVKNRLRGRMPSPVRLGSLLRSGPLLVVLGLAGVATAVTVAQPSLSLPSASGGSITDSPKEVIDQVWQIVYRDFLDSSGSYSPDRWKQLRRQLLAQSYSGTGECTGDPGHARQLEGSLYASWIPRNSRRCRSTRPGNSWVWEFSSHWIRTPGLTVVSPLKAHRHRRLASSLGT